MELYLHIPFCARKCNYCDFVSFSGMEDWMPRYVDALVKEAAWKLQLLDHPVMDTVFIGGGTPSLLPADLLEKLLCNLRSVATFHPDAEWTCEANPGTLTRLWLEKAASLGVNRLSLGMQAAQDSLLNTLGRIHRFRDVTESVVLARSCGIQNINLDLMFGLPGQTCAQWEDSLEKALSLSPTHLSCYGLIPEEGTPLKHDLDAGCLKLPDEAIERVMYDNCLQRLSKAGFRQYEISNFALPGYECRHNIGYWKQVPYLGLGVAAASMLPCAEPETAYIRTMNPCSLSSYIRMIEEKSPPEEEIRISRQEAMYETLMLGLRLTEGVSEQDFERLHGISLDSYRGKLLSMEKEKGFLVHDQGRWFLTRRGMDIQNSILVDLMDEP